MWMWWALLTTRSRIDSATTGLGNSEYQSVGGPVGGDDEAASGSFGDQLVEVVGLGRGEVTHGEVVEDEQVGAGPASQPGLPGAVGVTAGEIGEQPDGLGERRRCGRRRQAA